ncbi:MAG: glucuronate isomerase [Clostridia bacterium]|nr:glucuronate isomerase [Clostridia bacterium]
MAEFKDRPVNLLKTRYAEDLYKAVKDLPIIDYHCHLSPKEIYEDKVFDNIGEMWLAGDHYKWRLMRANGVEERFITGGSTWEEKFYKFIETVSTAYGNPIQDWVALELEMFFDIKLALKPENAKTIWELANKKIKDESLSPRKLIKMANVEYIATTDDPIDSLEYHKLLQEDTSFGVKVVPSFRVDNILLAKDKNYPVYIAQLSHASGIKILDIDTLQKAILSRMDFFKSMGCKFSDVGIQGFPKRVADRDEANDVFRKLITGKEVTDAEYNGFLGFMYLFLGKAYTDRKMVMQLHLAVTRNSNSQMFEILGKDAGFDCVSEVIPITYIRNIIDALNSNNALPETIIYTLNPAMYYTLITMIGAFRNVHLGISWWFCDHKRGMYETLEKLTELSHIKSLVGMLTDSRSFLSYVRHDYYRQIVCDFLGGIIKEADDLAIDVAKALCYTNAKKIIEEK